MSRGAATGPNAVDDLAAWLTQIWDEDQQAAEACAEVYPSPWDVSDRGHTAYVRADEPHFRLVAELEQHPAVDGWLGDRLQHIARHDPAATLARIAADRQILARYRHALDQRRDHPDDLASAGSLLALLGIVKLLASAYADRPGYQEAWRP